MFEWIKKMWLGSEIVEFKSAYGLAESVERLRNATKRSIFSALARQEAVGTVKPERVSLRRVIPMTGNSHKPYFCGQFLERDGQVFLSGRFGMHWLVKVFMVMWFGFALVMCGLFALGAGTVPKEKIGMVLIPFGLVLWGVLVTRFGQWLARNDAAWLSNIISVALSAPAHGQGSAATPIVGRWGVSPGITVIAALAAASGLWYLWLAIFGKGALSSYYEGNMPPPLLRFVGIAMIIWAYGTYRRNLYAWRTGFIGLAGAWIYSLFFQLPAIQAQTHDRFAAVFWFVGTNVVVIGWALWWRAQRIYFDELN